ncbi:poly [ADP-ribose] polymerase tankyrase-1-like isoform X3 [Schistocerca gregaria]|uniref:poly [ADP-ribose] polymerase tankyrase-1-like isoform X3 n=1 Tax=Schistocerca gregaria TaxID=7010 RepID=UPI00211E37E8|nr:poly [ADP-ribose] polymerase tankyrase-1-like isoform X3 [Schistocerca gregaria]
MEAVKEVVETAAFGLGDLLDAGDGAVVTLVAGDTRLAAHRAVLAARSPVLGARFQHDTPQVAITDAEGPVLRQLLAYCYTLQAPQLPSMAPQLLAAADKYGLSGLKDACEQQLAAQLHVENAAATAVLALSHSCSRLKEAAVAFIKTHTYEVVMTQGWADAVVSHPRAVVELTCLITEPSAPTSAPASTVGGPATTEGGPATTEGGPVTTEGGPATTGGVPATTEGGPATTEDEGTMPATTEVGPTPASHSQLPCDPSQAHVTAALPTIPHHKASPDEATASPMRNLSGRERGRRLIQAAKQGTVEVLQALLEIGADVGARDENWSGWTALHWAAYWGDAEAVRCLVDGGAEVDARDHRKIAPLHLAAFNGHTAVVQMLLASSADPNSRHHWGGTPLHAAAYSGHADVVAVLLEAGTEMGARDNMGKTSLDYARLNKHQHLEEMLS